MFARGEVALRLAGRLQHPLCAPRRPIAITAGQLFADATGIMGSQSLPHARQATLSTSAPLKKRPSPYRLLQPHTFLAEFAPLHVAGWRLQGLSTGDASLRMEDGMEDLQGRRLVRVYRFPEGKEGWRDLTKLVGTIGTVVEEEDHHPSVIISPATDYRSAGGEQSSSSGYVLAVSTHTHTPMPPLRTPIPSSGADTPQPLTNEKMRPGVTGKDTKLAERIEEAYTTLTGGVPA